MTDERLAELEAIAAARDAVPELVAEVRRLRAKNAELNRRCQFAESAARDTVEACRRKGMPFGRCLANWAATDQSRKREALESEVERLKAWIARLEAFARDIESNYDHEEAYHRNEMADVCCRVCKAGAVLREGKTNE